MPHIKTVTFVEIDGVQFSEHYLASVMPTIRALAEIYTEHKEKINDQTVLELEDPESSNCYDVWWSDLAELAENLPKLLP